MCNTHRCRGWIMCMSCRLSIQLHCPALGFASQKLISVSTGRGIAHLLRLWPMIGRFDLCRWMMYCRLFGSGMGRESSSIRLLCSSLMETAILYNLSRLELWWMYRSNFYGWELDEWLLHCILLWRTNYHCICALDRGGLMLISSHLLYTLMLFARMGYLRKMS